MTEVADFSSALCPACGQTAKWEKGKRGGLLVSCGDCGLERADAHEVERRLGAPEFQAIGEGRYRLEVPGIVALEVDFLRRESRQLKGELLARCDLPGARTYGGVLSIGDLNLSSPRARKTQANYLAERAQAKDLDWTGWLEELSQRVLTAEREGQPAVLLSDLERPGPEEALEVGGLPLLRRHPVILFGDGGTAKSYLALHIAGTLVKCGLRVGLFDWELAGEDHRDRLELLFGPDMPEVRYARCTRALVHERDRLRRIIRDERLDYCIFDSIAFACDGPPESAEVAGHYFQALRQLGEAGSLHIAHTTKAIEGADRRPFGSTFWHNGARATWNAKLAQTAPDDDTLTVGLYNRKQNLGPLRPAAGFEFTFQPDRTHVRRIDLANVEDLAKDLSTWERIRLALRAGPLTREQLKAELEDVKEGTLRTALSRAKERGHLLEFPGERISLPERRYA